MVLARFKKTLKEEYLVAEFQSGLNLQAASIFTFKNLIRGSSFVTLKTIFEAC